MFGILNSHIIHYTLLLVPLSSAHVFAKTKIPTELTYGNVVTCWWFQIKYSWMSKATRYCHVQPKARSKWNVIFTPLITSTKTERTRNNNKIKLSPLLFTEKSAASCDSRRGRINNLCEELFTSGISVFISNIHRYIKYLHIIMYLKSYHCHHSL